MPTQTNRGVIGTIVLIIAALIILGYFQISFKSIATSPMVVENLTYAWHLFVHGITIGLEWFARTIQQAAG